MRKFVIKNRQKRKYTKKSTEIPTFSFSKTAYSMVPLLVMLIAFMSTMIISAPVRNAFTHISFTFALPQFSLTNPFQFFQTLLRDFSQSGILFWIIIRSYAGAISQSFSIADSNVTQSSNFLISILTLCSNDILTTSLFVFQETIKMISALDQFIYFFALQCFDILRIGITVTNTFFSNVLVIVAEDISTITHFIAYQTIMVFTLVVHQTIRIFTQAAHFITIATVLVINLFVFIGKTVLSIIVSAAILIGTLATRTALNVLHAIEIPFKIVYAFWLQIKPYVVFFGKHVQMSGADFSNMITSMYKVAKLMGAVK